MGKSFQLDSSKSLYLLGQTTSTPLFKRYQVLIEKCFRYGEFLSFETTPGWLSCYQQDAQLLHTKLPLLIFRPHTIESISPFLHMCFQMDFPVTTRCGGTGLVGGCVPSTEGIVLLTGHLKKIKNYNPEKGTLCIEPGVTVRQLNQYVEADQWFFPLSFATEGVAGFAGCLSSHTKGYHQQHQAIFDTIESVQLVDGQGQLIEVPAHFVCGAEGLWGVITEMRVQLKRRPSHDYHFMYQGSWQDILTQLSLLRSLRSLTFIVGFQEKFYFGLAGDSWRLDSVVARLTQMLPDIQKIACPLKNLRASFIPSRQAFTFINCTFNTLQLPDACAWALQEAQHLQLECLQQTDLLAGSLHLILQSAESPYLFAQKMEQFFVLLVDFLDRCKGVIATCHGVGMQMRAYMTPFWTEETLKYWKKLQVEFDPKDLLSKERFFPPFGKSLQKVRQTLC